jgi:hypothetical protein
MRNRDCISSGIRVDLRHESKETAVTEWWDLKRIRQYIQDGGLNEEEMLEPNPRLL